VYGSMEHTLANGLVHEDSWAYGQRIMIADVSRLTNKDVGQSILITGTTVCSQGTDVILIAAYERSFIIDRITGEVEYEG